MPGTETQSYDMVMEFSEQAYQELLGALFDSDGFLCRILNRIGAETLCGAFTVDVLFDRPTDVALPALASDTLDIRVGLGEAGSLGSLRMVVGMDVDRSDGDTDLLRLNFQDRLFHASADIASLPIPSSALENTLRDDIRFIPLLPVPVSRTSSEPTQIRSLDARIIDDTSSEDRDASAALLTFGGGTEGNLEGFSRGLVPPGNTGAIAIFFGWLCRILEPALEGALDLPAGSFTDCRLNRTVRIDEDEDVDLTRLEMSLQDGFMQVLARVEKSGFCYTASGTVSARLLLRIEDGRLLVESEVGDPDMDLDIPWYCWIGAAFLGGLLGGILLGAVGAIVGAVLVPLLTWIATEAIEGTVEEIAERVRDAINDVSPSVNVPAVGVEVVFQDVFIDDITIGADFRFLDTVPVRAEGTLTVLPGQAVDLDNGKVGNRDLPGADLLWERPHRFWGLLKTLCTSALARTGTRRMPPSRYVLYNYPYESPTFVPLPELATIDPFGFLTGDSFDETGRVFGVKTNEGRYAAMRVVDVENRAIRIQYKTFEKLLATVEIHGGFACERPPVIPEAADIVFEPLTPVLPEPGEPAGEGSGEGGTPPIDVVHDLCRAVTRAAMVTAPAETSHITRHRADRGRIGRWSASFLGRSSTVGRFDAITQGFRDPRTFAWSINGERLENSSGEIASRGVTFSYQISESRLVLRTTAKTSTEIELGVTVRDANEVELSTTRCVEYRPQCPRKVRHLPGWTTYRAAFRDHFGVVELAGMKDGECEGLR